MTEQLLTVEQVAETLQLNPQTVRRMLKARQPKPTERIQRFAPRAEKYLKQGLKTVKAIERRVNKPKSGPKKKPAGRVRKAKPEG